MKYSEQAYWLISLLRNGDEEERWGAVTTMGALGLCECEDFLIEALLSDSSPRVRSGAAWALGFVGGPSGVKALVRTLVDIRQRREVRRDAASALGDILRRSSSRPYSKDVKLEPSIIWEVEEALLSVASDRWDWSEVRIESLNSLSAAGRRRCRLFARIVRDKGERIDVRVAACRNLGRVWGRPAVAAVREALKSNSPYLRLAALEALYEAQPPEDHKESLREDLTECSRYPEPAVREQSLLLLADWGDEHTLHTETPRKGITALTSGLLVYRGSVDPQSRKAEEMAEHPVPEVKELALLGSLWDALGEDPQRAHKILDKLLTKADTETLFHLLDFLEEDEKRWDGARKGFLERAAVAIATDPKRPIDLRLDAAKHLTGRLPKEWIHHFLDMAEKGGWETVVSAIALGERERGPLQETIKKAMNAAKDPSLRIYLASLLPSGELRTDSEHLAAAVAERSGEVEVNSLFAKDWRLRMVTARGILKKPPDKTSLPSEEQLEHLMEDDDPYVVAAAIKLLSKVKKEKIQKKILAVLEKSNSEVVVKASMEALGLSADLVRICEMRLREGRTGVRVAILKTLVGMSKEKPLWRDPSAMGFVKVVRETLQSGDEVVRLSGVVAAAELLQMDAVAEMLCDPSPAVRQEALQQMAKLLSRKNVVASLPDDMKKSVAEKVEPIMEEYPQEVTDDEMGYYIKILGAISPAGLLSLLRRKKEEIRGNLLGITVETLEHFEETVLEEDAGTVEELAVKAIWMRKGVKSGLRLLKREKKGSVLPLAREILLEGGSGSKEAAEILFEMGERGRKVIEKAMGSAIRDVRLAVLDAAEEAPLKRLKWIVEALWDTDAAVRGKAAAILKKLPSDKVLKHIKRALMVKGRPPPSPDANISELFKETENDLQGDATSRPSGLGEDHPRKKG